MQPFHGWCLSFLGHNKSPSKPVKRHSTGSVNNDFSCLANFWCSQHQSRAGGNKNWSCWNPALPKHNVMSARPASCCLKHVQPANSHCAGSKITQDLFKDIQLLMLLYLMPTSCYWQSVWSLQNWICKFSFSDSDLVVRPKNLELIFTTMKDLAALLITMQNPFTVYALKWVCRQCNPCVTHNTKLNTPQGK